MNRMVVELSALGFQAVVTLLMALVYLYLWRRQRRPYFASWAIAWACYGLRILFISAYIVWRQDLLLFAHQAATGLAAALLLLAAFQFSRGVRWRRRYLWIGAATVVWAYLAIFAIGSMMAAGITSVALLSGVTFWTGIVFWRQRRQFSGWAQAVAIVFILWSLHHLDYPLLRPLGEGVLYGVFADVIFILGVSMLTMFMVLREGRRALEARTAQLEQLTRLLLRAQEDERRRIARELHDEAGQVLTAVKIELDMEGRQEASKLVGRALAQVRNLSNLLRPSVLDDLGLRPALHGLAEDFTRRTHIRVDLAIDEEMPALPPELHVVIYRVTQEALTNVARHAHAHVARVGLNHHDDRVVLRIDDDGHGVEGEPKPHLGLLGIRERVAAVGGFLHLGGAPGGGFWLEAVLPIGASS